MDLNIFHIAIGVLIGNAMTLSGYLCLKAMDVPPRQAPGWAIGGFLVICALALAGILPQMWQQTEKGRAGYYQSLIAAQP